MNVCRYDFSEPQLGKDICDRIICPLKSSVRKYCDEGDDVSDAQQMHAACMNHPVRGTSVSVNKINKSATHLNAKKIKNVSASTTSSMLKMGLKFGRLMGSEKARKYATRKYTSLIRNIQR